MKIIIIEGLDNTGKTTVIKRLNDYYENKGLSVYNIHCKKPGPEVSADMLVTHMSNEYEDIVKSLISYEKNNIYDIAIIDRCWYSECVYGPLYRNRSELETQMFQKHIEDKLCSNISIDNISLVLLDVDNFNFCIAHEDGESLSKKNIDKIRIEQKLFRNSFENSILTHKADIIVNSGLSFKDKNIIFNNILNVIE